MLNGIGASDVSDDVATFDFGTREFTATAVTEVFAVAIQRDQLLALIAERPEITHQITRLLARRAEVMTKNLVDFVFADPPYRVASRLLLLGKRFGRREGDVVRVTHDLTLEEMSLYAGMTGTRSTQRCAISRTGDGFVLKATVWRSWTGRASPLFPRGMTLEVHCG